MNFGEAKTRVRELMGERKLVAPAVAPTCVATAGPPFWPLAIYKIAVHFIYAEGTSARGPSFSLDLTGSPNSKPNITALPLGAAGTLGRLIVATRANGDAFYRVGTVMNNETTTFVFPIDDSDLDQTQNDNTSRITDAELLTHIDYYNKQVQSETQAILNLAEVTLITDTASYAIPADALLINGNTLAWLEGYEIQYADETSLTRVDPLYKHDTNFPKGTPVYFYQTHDKTKIAFYPVPPLSLNTKKVKLKYAKKLTTLAADGDNLLNNEYPQYHDLIPYSVASILFEKRRDFVNSQIYKQKYMMGLSELRGEVKRSIISPDIIPVHGRFNRFNSWRRPSWL